ncbi:MAG: hypothetical protein OXC62_04550 [Aestuariivita sp.]|nr:hypothetical protein [Aestuariivita sp.]
MKRVLAILIVCLVTILLLYISRFWPVELWSRRSFLGELGFRPNGGMLGHWLRGTPFAQFELLIWVVIGFLALSLIERQRQTFFASWVVIGFLVLNLKEKLMSKIKR